MFSSVQNRGGSPTATTRRCSAGRDSQLRRFQEGNGVSLLMEAMLLETDWTRIGGWN